MNKVFRLLLAGIAAWLTGLAVILMWLRLSNGGSDFTLNDIQGFGVLFVVASGLLMLIVYLPVLFWLKRRRKDFLWFPLWPGLLLNLPLFVLLVVLINRKVTPSEAISMMVIFAASGAVFGLGFFRGLVRSPRAAGPPDCAPACPASHLRSGHVGRDREGRNRNSWR